MAEKVLSDPYVGIGGNDLSDHFKSLSLPVEADVQEATAFGDGWRVRLGGLKDWQATLEYNQDYDAGQLDAVMFPLLGTNVAVEFRPDKDPVGANNPKFTGNMIVSSYSPIDGPVGETITGSLSLMGNGPLTRAVT